MKKTFFFINKKNEKILSSQESSHNFDLGEKVSINGSPFIIIGIDGHEGSYTVDLFVIPVK